MDGGKKLLSMAIGRMLVAVLIAVVVVVVTATAGLAIL